MKYVIIIPDGAADLPLDELDGRTPLEAANIPTIDWISSNGKIGTVCNVPKNLPCGSDVAILSLLGYDPRKCYTGRAPLEAAAIDLQVAPDEWIFRCNLVTIIDRVMEDYCAGHISTEEAGAVIDELNRLIAGGRVKFYRGVSYRHLMTFKGECDLKTPPPHDIIGKGIDAYLPTGQGADVIRTLMERSGEVLANYEINTVRRDLGENPATHIWLWGQGKMPQLPSFAERFGIRGVAITAVDLVRGLAKLIGWDRIEVEGATGYVDTNYKGKGAAAIEALDSYDLVLVHVEAPDEAGVPASGDLFGHLGSKLGRLEGPQGKAGQSGIVRVGQPFDEGPSEARSRRSSLVKQRVLKAVGHPHGRSEDFEPKVQVPGVNGPVEGPGQVVALLIEAGQVAAGAASLRSSFEIVGRGVVQGLAGGGPGLGTRWAQAFGQQVGQFGIAAPTDQLDCVATDLQAVVSNPHAGG